MKNLKRIGAIILALAMMFALSVTAFAAEAIPEGGVISQTTTTSITIRKEITAYNPDPDGITINSPSITYSYSIEPGSSEKTITDSNNISAVTVAGPDGATITASISWNAETDQMTTTANGSANYKTITVDLSAVDFPAAGVYRYKITETCNYEKTGVVEGVVDGGDNHIRYLDVYVKNSDTAEEYIIYGYVLFTNNNSIDGSSGHTDETSVSAAKKTEGFVGENADKYYTYNLTVKKILNGDDGMLNHEFPFGISFVGEETGVLPIISGNAGTKPTWTAKGTMDSFNINVHSNKLKIASNKSAEIKGIPVGTKVTLIEKNDVAGTTYLASSEGADTNAAPINIGTGVTSNEAIVKAQTAGEAEDKIVTFNNSLKLISPTGIVMRFAPYALILGAGIVLLIVALKRKSRKHDDD